MYNGDAMSLAAQIAERQRDMAKRSKSTEKAGAGQQKEAEARTAPEAGEEYINIKELVLVIDRFMFNHTANEPSVDEECEKEEKKRTSTKATQGLVRQDNMSRKSAFVCSLFPEKEWYIITQFFEKNMTKFEGQLHCFKLATLKELLQQNTAADF